MPVNSLLMDAGARPQKEPKWTSIATPRFMGGYFSQRNPLQDPSETAVARFYGGKQDVLWNPSLNVEISNENTVKRRYGVSAFSGAIYPTVVLNAFGFELANSTIQVIVDTGSTTTFALTAVSSVSAGVSAVYTGTITNGGTQTQYPDGLFAGLYFEVEGFDSANNNGTFLCISSTGTQLVLANTNASVDTHAATAVSAGAVYYDVQSQSSSVAPILLFAKQPAAGQSGMIPVAGNLYVGDGVDTWVYTPNGANGTIWDWGITAPATQPSILITESAASAVTWQAATVFSTMGILVDSNGNAQQLNSVNADGSNPSTRFGISSNGQPAWNQNTGSTTSDGSVTWQNIGPVTQWAPKTNYQYLQPICVEVGSAWFVFVSSHTYGTTSGATPPKWATTLGISGSRITETSGQRWECIGSVNGSPSCIQTWKAGKTYSGAGSPDITATNCATIEPSIVLPPAANQLIYIQIAQTGGTTNTTSTPPTWATALGADTFDGQLSWTCLGSATWAATTNYSAWSLGASTFSVIKDQNGNLQVCSSTGASGTVEPNTTTALTQVVANSPVGGEATYKGTFSTPLPVGNSVTITGFTNSGNNVSGTILSSSTTQFVIANSTAVNETHAGSSQFEPWATSYGGQTAEGSVIWTCIGSSIAWAANTQWYLPVNGFALPTSSQPYGGASILDTNSPVDLEFCVSTGLSGSSHPSWSTPGTTTADGAGNLKWFNDGAAPTHSLAWTAGYTYAYSFASRLSTDSYNTTAPPGFSSALGIPTGSLLGDISTASPFAQIVGANTGAVNTISGVGSTNPAVDTIIIWRSPDSADGSDSMLYLTEIPNPVPLPNGNPGTWSFQDYLPDVPATISGIIYPGLNTLIPAPIDDVNDPPPSNAIPFAYNFERIWCGSGQSVIWSAGPDNIISNPNSSFNPADEFPYTANVVNCIKTSQGLLVFLTNSVEIIAGGPSSATFYPLTLSQGIGLRSRNAVGIYAGELFFLSSDSELKTIDPSLSLGNTGFAVGDQLAKFNSSTASIAVHQVATDNFVAICNGPTGSGSLPSGYFRVNPRQVPGISQPEPCWSPFSAITGGVNVIMDVEVSPGIKKMLVGSPSGNSQILQRDLSVFTDNGVAFPAYFTIGSLMLAHAGSIAAVKFCEFDTALGTNLSCSYLPNEIYGNFTSMPGVVADPPELYGNALITATEPFAGSSLDANWTVNAGTYSVANGICQTATVGAGSVSLAFWNADTFGPNQVAQVCIAGPVSSENTPLGPAVRVAPTGQTCYGFYAASTTWYLFRELSGSSAILASGAYVPSQGDELTLSISGSVLVASINGDVVAIETDTNITTGQPGIIGFDVAITGISSWVATSGSAMSYSPYRFYMSSSGQLARARHMQLYCDFGTTSNPDEVFNCIVAGRIVIEN